MARGDGVWRLTLLVALAVGPPAPAAAQSAGDFDGDAVPNAADNCPFARNPGQSDVGGLAGAPPDGAGDDCQCGDGDDDGIPDLRDVAVLSRALALLPPGLATPAKCSVTGGSSDCDATDLLALRQGLVGEAGAVAQVCRAAVGASDLPLESAAAGDSITQAFAADCDCNTDPFCLLCLLAGDQEQHSWFDGSDGDVFSLHDRYLFFDPGVGADKSAAVDGARMRGGGDSFSIQADRILGQTPTPDLVVVLLGGNDLCSRDCVAPASCSSPLFTDAEWTEALRAGLDKLADGLPAGASVYLLGVPRVQDLRQAGLDKQASTSAVDCEGAWATFDICRIATQASPLNGESLATRLAGIAARQRRYNEILRDEAEAYTTNSNGRNPAGIEVASDYVDEATPSIGTLGFGADDIDGGDCFHPSLAGQGRVAEGAWNGSPRR